MTKTLDPVEVECPLCGVERGAQCHGQIAPALWHEERERSARTVMALQEARWLCARVEQLETFLGRNRQTRLAWGLTRLLQEGFNQARVVRELLAPLGPLFQELED